MSLVIISNNETTLGTGEQRSSSVYHSTQYPCGVTPKPGSPHRLEVEEDLAKAFGRHLCGLCRDTAERAADLAHLKQVVAETLDGLDLERLTAALPHNIELRVLAHGRTKTPKVIWTNRPAKEETS